jgi:hypothetical protein
MNPVPFILLAISLPLLLGGCGEKTVSEVKPEEPVAETKPVEELPLNPNLNYEIKGDAVTITGCTSLTSITIGNGVTSIGDEAFADCISLTSITIGNGVTSIGEGAFDRCSNLTSITIPNGVTSIGSAAFFQCTSLTAVIFLGDAPKAGLEIFIKSSPTIYRKPETKGWGETFAGRPVKLISEKP